MQHFESVHLYIFGSATQKLLEKQPSLMKMTKADGKSALHIAAFNDHRQVASLLILKVVILCKQPPTKWQ